MKRKFKIGIAALALIAAVSTPKIIDTVQRLQYATSLFTGQEQYENFAKASDLFPVSTVTPASVAQDWETGAPLTLPESFLHKGERSDTQTFLEETDTAAFLVLHKGKISYENYWLTGGEDVHWTSWSVAKSFISALVGIAVSEGHIQSVDDPVSDYIPELKNSGYNNVSIEDILQMSSGASWNEDYSDFNSDINRLGRIIALGGSLDKFVASIGPDMKPGTYNRYNSADTQVLGQLLVKVTGRTIADYMSEKLWQPLGAETEGRWLVDNKGMEMAFAGFNATARDYARIGELYRQGGKWNGQQIIPAEWIKASTSVPEDHLKPGPNPASNNDFGYGYQWWLLDGDQGEYTAMGVYNQFVYVNPARDIVIVKLSANSDFGVTDDQSSYRDQETISLLRAVAADKLFGETP